MSTSARRAPEIGGAFGGENKPEADGNPVRTREGLHAPKYQHVNYSGELPLAQGVEFG